MYVHVRQEWTFLSQNGDVLPNHVVDTYGNAIDRELESHTAKTYLNLVSDV
jgi:triacylglycerol lipase